MVSRSFLYLWSEAGAAVSQGTLFQLAHKWTDRSHGGGLQGRRTRPLRDQNTAEGVIEGHNISSLFRIIELFFNLSYKFVV